MNRLEGTNALHCAANLFGVPSVSTGSKSECNDPIVTQTHRFDTRTRSKTKTRGAPVLAVSPAHNIDRMLVATWDRAGLALQPLLPARQDYESPYAGVVARFCKAVLNSRPMTIYGDGKQSRDFTYIDNVISANLLAAAAPEEKIAGRIFDCATGNSVSVLELAEALAELTGRRLAQSLEPSRVGDIRDSRANISAIESELGYRVLVSWKEGLRRTLEFYRLPTADVEETASRIVNSFEENSRT